jgi:hypothetical protein
MQNLRPPNAEFAFGRYDETTCPCLGCLVLKEAFHFHEKGASTRVAQANKQDTGMSSGLETTHI